MAIFLGLVLLVAFPKLTGKVGKGSLVISGPIGFIMLAIGVLT